MDKSTHSNMRPASGNKDKHEQVNKDQVIGQLESILIDRIKNMLKDGEVN